MADDLALDLERFREMRRFYLVQHGAPDDSETGVVAVGVVFPDPNGKVVLGWLTEPTATETFDSLDGVLARHEEQGSTEVVFPTDLDE